MEATDETVQLVERVAALDIGKASLMACIRVPNERTAGRRRQEVAEYATTTGALLRLADRLRELGVTRVAMEATSDYWKPVFYLLEAEGFQCWLLNATHVKNVPGRPKTDKLDAVWLAKVLERGMCAPSFVPPKPIRRLRDLTRYRRSLIRDRTREKQRLEKLLEDAQIKLSVVASDMFGVSGRAILAALIAGQRDPQVLAELARGRLRSKISQLREALTGHFQEHHALLCAKMLDRVDAMTADIAEVSTAIEAAIRPYDAQVNQLDEVTGIGVTCAQELIAELGVDMTVFPTAAHLASWARFAPRANQSAGKNKPATTGKGNPWLASTLGEITAVLARSDTFLGERYRRLSRRRGKLRAIVATGNSVLTVVWHLLNDPNALYHDLGADFHDTRYHQRHQHNLIIQLERATGQKVTLTARDEPAAA
ncbi:IS110 family transposase [Dactylosporangium sp. NPDC006015]|uniref:IS110 family transposase n=1 Tax=Dactylosporangium sp. NPDC006015 TaxID=3154576 RepID=UPI0033A4C1EC